MENTTNIVDHSSNPPFEYNIIIPQLYLGTNACCTVHFEKDLLTQGVRADISLEAERIDAAHGAEYFLWLPTIDHTAPTMAKLRVGTHVMRELIQNGEKVYVHCRNGHGRGPSLVIAYFILTGDDYETAFNKVKKGRHVIHLEDVQIERLKEFETWTREHHNQDAE